MFTFVINVEHDFKIKEEGAVVKTAQKRNFKLYFAILAKKKRIYLMLKGGVVRRKYHMGRRGDRRNLSPPRREANSLYDVVDLGRAQKSPKMPVI